MSEISINEVSSNFADYVNRVASGGEHFILPRLPDSEIQSFAQDLVMLREAGNQEMLKDPWQS